MSFHVHDLTIGPAGPQTPTVIAVHGITGNGLNWTLLAELLGERFGPGGVRLLAVDRALIRLTEIRDALCGSEWVRVARGGQRISLILGSRPIDDQSQNRTVAARAMAERKTFGHLS